MADTNSNVNISVTADSKQAVTELNKVKGSVSNLDAATKNELSGYQQASSAIAEQLKNRISATHNLTTEIKGSTISSNELLSTLKSGDLSGLFKVASASADSLKTAIKGVCTSTLPLALLAGAFEAVMFAVREVTKSIDEAKQVSEDLATMKFNDLISQSEKMNDVWNNVVKAVETVIDKKEAALSVDEISRDTAQKDYDDEEKMSRLKRLQNASPEEREALKRQFEQEDREKEALRKNADAMDKLKRTRLNQEENREKQEAVKKQIEEEKKLREDLYNEYYSTLSSDDVSDEKREELAEQYNKSVKESENRQANEEALLNTLKNESTVLDAQAEAQLHEVNNLQTKLDLVREANKLEEQEVKEKRKAAEEEKKAKEEKEAAVKAEKEKLEAEKKSRDEANKQRKNEINDLRNQIKNKQDEIKETEAGKLDLVKTADSSLFSDSLSQIGGQLGSYDIKEIMGSVIENDPNKAIIKVNEEISANVAKIQNEVATLQDKIEKMQSFD